MNYEEMMEDILDMSEKYVVAKGSIDIEKYNNQIGPLSHITFNTREVPWVWIVMGKGPEEMITDCLMNSTWEVTLEGHYNFKAIFKYEPPEYGDYGRMIMSDYYDLCHIDLVFEETFIERKRNEALYQVLDEDFFKF